MDDKSILFFSISMMLIFFYRIFLSIQLLLKKKYLIDEKYYIAMFYSSLVGILVLFSDWLVVGIILFLLLPIVLTLYVSFAPTRKYWIINGYEITESTFVNNLIIYDEKFANSTYRINRVKISRKIKEKMTRLDFVNLKYEEKEQLLKLIIDICRKNCKKANKKEVISIIINSLFNFVLSLFIFFVLFT